MSDALLSVRNLTIDYIGAETDFRAVDDVSFDVAPGEVFGLAGESGCGKSTIAFAVSRLHGPPALIRKGSEIRLAGRDVLGLDKRALADFRWREVALLAATRGADGKLEAKDPIDRQSARANFYALIYPGGLPRTDIEVTKDTPPVFLAAGYGDRQNIAEGLAEFYLKCKRAGALAELHMYAGAGHGFGVRDTNKSPSGAWIARFQEWIADRKFMGGGTN